MSRLFSIENTTRAKLPRVDFHAIKDALLGKKYNLTLTLIDSVSIKTMNMIYRGKDVATDILSFPLGKNEGEIYICRSEARKESKKFDRTYDNFIAFLFIHGCTHLKGFDHGGTMERLEVEYRKKFEI